MATPFDDLVTCPVCFEFHDDPKRLPVCEHVFCAPCLGKIVAQGVIICPNCNSSNTVPTGSVKDLKTDQTVKKMVESFRCTDCKNVEQQTKQCIYCHVVICSTCSRIHDSKEKCGLISEIRSLSLKVPTREEIQTIEQLEVEWTIFREKNTEEKNETAASIDQLVKLLQEKKTTLMKNFDEYDEYAEERLKWLKEAKEMETIVYDLQKYIKEKNVEAVQQAQTNAESRNEFLSKKKQILSEHVPDHLGSVGHISELLEDEISNLGGQITRRKAGKDIDSEIVWCTQEGQMWEYDSDSDARISGDKLAEGKIELLRERGGNYTLRVVDGNDSVKWSSGTWNNDDDDKASMYFGFWTRVPWCLEENDEVKIYDMTLTKVFDTSNLNSFREAMMHTKRIKTNEL